MGASTSELATATQAELKDEGGRHLGFDIHSDARELHLAGVNVQGIRDADVETREDAVAFLEDEGFSRKEADTFGPAVMAKLGWSKGGKCAHAFCFQLLSPSPPFLPFFIGS